MVASAQISYPTNTSADSEEEKDQRPTTSESPDVAQDDDIDGYTPQELGRKGEEAACRYLQLRGYEILERNWTCRFGEADVIARDPEGVLCFIEVKTRRGVNAGLPEEAITKEKQSRYERIASCFLMDFDDWEDNDPVRFDAIGICVIAPHRALLRHHRGCFNGCF